LAPIFCNNGSDSSNCWLDFLKNASLQQQAQNTIDIAAKKVVPMLKSTIPPINCPLLSLLAPSAAAKIPPIIIKKQAHGRNTLQGQVSFEFSELIK